MKGLRKGSFIYELLKNLWIAYERELWKYHHPYLVMALIGPLPSKQKQKYYRAIYSLTKRGYLKRKGHRYALTNKCRDFFVLEDKTKGNLKRKGYWFLVSFDIPEKKSRERRRFRSLLKRCGFEKMHKSLWISPYDFKKI